MSLNPLNELKRRLDDNTTSLTKRLCLARNIVHSHHFPTAPKERIIAEWLEGLSKANELDSTELQKVLDWLNNDDLTGELKSKVIQMVSQYVQKNILQSKDIQFIIKFLENDKISSQMSQQIDDFLSITITLLQCLNGNEITNIQNVQKILSIFIKYYKDSKKKLEFVTKFIEKENLETVFSYLVTENRTAVIEVCQNILFHANKKSLYLNYLQTLIRNDSLDNLIAEKGDNIQAVLKIMSVFFEFPKQCGDDDIKYLQDFIAVFVSCYKNEGQMIFAFYIMAANIFNLKQDYITSSTIASIEVTEKIKRNLFLNMLKIVLINEVDISVKLADMFGPKAAKVQLKKNFLSFLQSVMIGQLKLEGKLDKTTLQIVQVALKLDPVLIEQNLDLILPPLMTAKKTPSVMESYIDLLNCLMEILFKLSRGNSFISDILPSLKINLMKYDQEQMELSEKTINKIITANDVFPEQCVELYGKLTTDLMFRQNKELLESLQKDFQMHCLSMLEENTVNPSTITLAEVMSAILSSYLRHNKMADHTVPQNIAQEFWSMFSAFENGGLKRFGLAAMKYSDNTRLLTSFLRLCQSYAQLKLLNIKYSHYKLDVLCTSQVFDLSGLLPCLDKQQWIALGDKIQDNDALVVLDSLILLKTMAMEVLAIKNSDENSIQALHEAKTHLIKRLGSNPAILESNTYIPRVLFANLDNNQCRQLAKSLVKLYLNDEVTEVFNSVAIKNNRLLLNALVLEVAKNTAKCLQNCEELSKALSKEFDMVTFAQKVDIKTYFNSISIDEGNEEKIKKCIELMKVLQISYLEENYQLTAVFMLLAIKKCCQSKKIRKSIDQLLQNIFELSNHPPDLYKVFPVDFIFCFKDTSFIDLLTLKIKTSNQSLVIKNLIESAVKRVKIESDLVKNIVHLLLQKSSKTNTIEAFSDPRFQISCIILPLLVKQRKVITAGAFRSILAELQEKLHKPLLDTFKNVDFSTGNTNVVETGNTNDSVVEDNIATLNAMAAYALTLSKYCESVETDDIKNLDCLWSGLEFFVNSAIQTIKNPNSKPQHIESSIHLLTIILRHIKKLETHKIFNDKDKLFTQIWLSIHSRLMKVFENGGSLKNFGFLDDLGLVLKFVCELVSVECFVNTFAGDLANLVVLKPPTTIIKDQTKSDITSHSVSKYIWSQCLKANTAGPKCGAMARLMHNNCNNLKSWIRQHYDSIGVARKRKLDVYESVKTMKVDDVICDVIRIDLDTLAEVVLAGKRVTLDYKFLDSIFELQHMVHLILGFTTTHVKFDITWHAFFTLFEGSIGVLNSLLVCREEILEDRWPCYMQCYKALASVLCAKSTSHTPLERHIEEKLAEIAHSMEKLTQSITKRKKHVSRISAYTVADICTALERNAPSKMVRQHLENSVAMFIQASDSGHAMAFLKRALAGSVGQMTMSNLYVMYKRYHKYTGNA